MPHAINRYETGILKKNDVTSFLTGSMKWQRLLHLTVTQHKKQKKNEITKMNIN